MSSPNLAVKSKGRACLKVNQKETHFEFEQDHVSSPQISCFKDHSKVLEMFLFSVLMHERLHLVNASHTQCGSHVQS